MQHTGDYFLAGTGLAANQHRQLAISHLLNQILDLLHLERIADKALILALGLQFDLEVSDFLFKLAAPKRVLQVQTHFFDVKRLVNEFGRSQLDTVDHGLRLALP